MAHTIRTASRRANPVARLDGRSAGITGLLEKSCGIQFSVDSMQNKNPCPEGMVLLWPREGLFHIFYCASNVAFKR